MSDKPIIRYESGDEPLHTESKPFCADLSCDCHTDMELLGEYITKPLNAGTLTYKEARHLWAGGEDK